MTTLDPDEIERRPRPVGRRSAIAVVGAAATGALGVLGIGVARAQDDGEDRPAHTDRDGGANADRPGRGVCAERGTTDADAAPGADQAGRGRGPCREE